MTHIIPIEDETDFTCLDDNERGAIIVKPARAINAGDEIIFENNLAQKKRVAVLVTDRPGLMKGYLLIHHGEIL